MKKYSTFTEKYLGLRLRFILVLATCTFVFSQVFSQALIWEKTMTKPKFLTPDGRIEYIGKTLTTDKKNNIYLGGSFSPSGRQTNRTCLSKFSPSGELIWEYEYPFHFAFPIEYFKDGEGYERLGEYFLGRYLYFNEKEELYFSGVVTLAHEFHSNDTSWIDPPSDRGPTSNNKHNPETGELINQGYIYRKSQSDDWALDYAYMGCFAPVIQELTNSNVVVADNTDFTITDERGVQVVQQIKYVSEDYVKPIFSFVNSIDKTSDGGVVVLYTIGSSPSPDWGLNFVIRSDSSGKIVWSKFIQKKIARASASICEMKNGDIAVMGYYVSKDSSERYYQDAELTMLSKNGDSLWTKTYKSKNKSAAMPKQMRVTPDGGLIVAGSDVNFVSDGVVGQYDYDLDIWLLRLDKHGNELWQTSRNVGVDRVEDISIDSNGDFIVTGHLNWLSMYLAKFRDTTNIVSVSNKVDENNILIITPNPARGRALVGIAENSGGGVVLLYNTLGQEIQRVEFGNVTNISLDLSGLVVGCYNAVIKTKRGVAVKKIIVN